MTKIKLRCTEFRVRDKMRKGNLTGQTHTFSIIGKVTFGEDNIIEVDEDKAEAFLKKDNGFLFEEVGKKKKVEKEEVTGSSKSEKEIYQKELEKRTLDNIKTLISIHPEKETKKLKGKKAQIEYLVNKQFPA